MRVKQTTISYLAGLVDGEGYVGIKKNLTSVRSGHSKSPLYHEGIQIRMVDESAIKLFKKVFGGSYYKETEHSKYSKRPLYCYKISDLSAAKALKILLPYLTIKKPQAKLCLKLRKSKESKRAKQRGNLGGRKKGKGKPMAKDILLYRDNLWKQIKQIHQKPRTG